MLEKIPEIVALLRCRFPDKSSNNVLFVSVPKQKLSLVAQGIVVAEYPVSTALNGAGNEMDSQKTPLGVHRIAEKIGARCDMGTVFRGRSPTGEILTDLQGGSAVEDLITSRILWLDGLEDGINRGGRVDSKQRYIYIHGTHDEARIGQAVSHGCIRMKNTDVIDLFDRVSIDDLVYISG